MSKFCFNSYVYCKCRTCMESEINDGICHHCDYCISGENAMNVCEEYDDTNFDDCLKD